MPLRPLNKKIAKRFCGLVIGQSGIGKTSLLKTIAGKKFNPRTKKWEGEYSNKEKIFVLSADVSLLAVQDMLEADLLDGCEIREYGDFVEAYNLLADTDPPQYQWIFIDTLTEICDQCVESLEEKYPAKKDSWTLYDDYAKKMGKLIKKFSYLYQYNIVFTCQESIDKDQDNCRYASPLIAGKALLSRIRGMFDEVFYMTYASTPNPDSPIVFRTRVRPFYPAKDRSGTLKEEEEPNLLTVSKKIKGEIESNG